MMYYIELWSNIMNFIFRHDSLSFFIFSSTIIPILILSLRTCFFLKKEKFFVALLIKLISSIVFVLICIFLIFLFSVSVLYLDDLNKLFPSSSFLDYLESHLLQIQFGSVSGIVLTVIGLIYVSRLEVRLMCEMGFKISNDKLSDVTETANFFKKIKKYNPLRYIGRKSNHIFLGLNQESKPIWLSISDFLESHILLLGPTRSGKGLMSSIVLFQAIVRDHATFSFCPKNDKWISFVLGLATKLRGKKLYNVNMSKHLLPNPFLDCQSEEIYEILVDGFSQTDKGRESDHYKLGGRKIARHVADVWGGKNPTFQNLLDSANELDEESKATGEGFIDRLAEVARLYNTRAQSNINFENIIKRSESIVITGNVLNVNITTLHQIYTTRVIQIINKRDFSEDYPNVTILFDELKFLLTDTLVKSYGSIMDKSVNYICTIQSIGDLHDVRSDQNSESVKREILDNTNIKWCYRAIDIETAKWASNMSGRVNAMSQQVIVDSNQEGTAVPRSTFQYNEIERNLFDINKIMMLPSGCGILFIGGEKAQISYACPIIVDRSNENLLTEIKKREDHIKDDPTGDSYRKEVIV